MPMLFFSKDDLSKFADQMAGDSLKCVGEILTLLNVNNIYFQWSTTYTYMMGVFYVSSRRLVVPRDIKVVMVSNQFPHNDLQLIS